MAAVPLIVDTSVLFGAADRNDTRHNDCVKLLNSWPHGLVVTAYVAAEADYLLYDRLGLNSQVAFVEDLADQYLVFVLDNDGYRQAASLCRKYGDQGIDLADASIVIAAHRLKSHDIATFDHRHFGALKALDGESFTLHPY